MKKFMAIFRALLSVALFIMFGVHYWNGSLEGMIFIGVLLISNLLIEIIDSIGDLSKRKNVNIENVTYHESSDKFDIGQISELTRRKL